MTHAGCSLSWFNLYKSRAEIESVARDVYLILWMPSQTAGHKMANVFCLFVFVFVCFTNRTHCRNHAVDSRRNSFSVPWAVCFRSPSQTRGKNYQICILELKRLLFLLYRGVLAFYFDNGSLVKETVESQVFTSNPSGNVLGLLWVKCVYSDSYLLYPVGFSTVITIENNNKNYESCVLSPFLLVL